MKRTDLTKGPILKTLTTLALPIMGTSFLQMAYNMVDMIWIGRLGSEAVAAVGSAGFFVWLSFSLIRLSQIGSEVKIAQSLGAEDEKRANNFANSALIFTTIIGLMYGLGLIVFKSSIIEIFNLNNSNVESLAESYLSIIGIGMVFHFINPILTGIFNGSGNSKMPFRVNSIGLVANIILDPIFIFVFKMGVNGAAIATVISQAIVTLVFIYMIISNHKPFLEFHFNMKLKLSCIKEIVKISYPVAIQSGLFTIFAILLARIIAVYGPTAIAVQKVGVQLEAISYMTAHGFATALSAFTGQNLGAKRWDRIREGIKSAYLVMTIFGILTSFLLFVMAKPIFSLFLNEEPALSMGIVYLRIISLSQLFMCIEISLAGAFNGLGKALPPSVVSIILTGLRVPFAILLAKPDLLGLNGVWWTISMSSVFKGIVMTIMIVYILKKAKEKMNEALIL